eukprot:TRINITY_DN12411_c0_g1_i10.p3 TRINITY_DN12411_c0_g1~~TRINITY_DN12411_c0_g1_i10.p3  ORF type:complete len:101 (+),score=8.21 TRINITY_DN12411_c0_g1_i10:681-983(+)
MARRAQTSLNCGETWSPPTAIAAGPIPVWEPFVMTINQTCATYVAYCKSLYPSSAVRKQVEQSIVRQQWHDNGTVDVEKTIATLRPVMEWLEKPFCPTTA